MQYLFCIANETHRLHKRNDYKTKTGINLVYMVESTVEEIANESLIVKVGDPLEN